MAKKTKDTVESLGTVLALQEQEADRLALQSDWKKLGIMNAKIAETEARLRARGANVDKVRAEFVNGSSTKSKKSRKKGKKAVSRETPSWYDEDDNLLDTGQANGKNWWTKGSYKGGYSKCAHSHPSLTIGPDGLKIQGGSCYSPQGQYDVEIMLCAGAKTPNVMLPWGTQFVRFPIVDQNVPDDRGTFDKLIDWTVEQMKAGKSVHVGCIGGHGRTGLFLSVLVNRITGQTDSTAWLRKHYCQKAVESKKQIDWLHKHYGIEKVAGSKQYGHQTEAKTKFDRDATSMVSFGGNGSAPKTWEKDWAVPVPGKSIWGKTPRV